MARPPFQISIAVPFDEAIAAAKARGVVLPEVFYGHLPAAARSRAFTVSGLAALDQVQGVMDSLAAATESGQTFRDWKKRVLEDVPAVAALPRDRLDNIFRTAIQTHYNVGRWEQLEGNRARRPYLMYDAINDGRTRPAHRAMDNHIAPIDDPIWNRWYPPNGFRCRCSVIGLTEAQARARGYGRQVTPAVEPDKGWAYHPARRQDEILKGAAAAKRAKAPGWPKQRAEKPPVGTEFVEQKTAKAAAKWAVDANLVDVADYARIDPETANAWNRSLWEHMTQFPELRKQQKFTGSAQAQIKRYKALATEAQRKALIARGLPAERAEYWAKLQVRTPRMGSTTWAHSWDNPYSGGIAVNEKFGSDPALLKARLAQNVANGFHPVGCDTIKSVVDHELGHQLDTLLNLRGDPDVIALWNETRGGPGIKAAVSEYASKNIAEFIAEAWSEYRNNPEPRRVANLIGRVVEARYRSKYGA